VQLSTQLPTTLGNSNMFTVALPLSALTVGISSGGANAAHIMSVIKQADFQKRI
jgi:hypothetical protein